MRTPSLAAAVTALLLVGGAAFDSSAAPTDPAAAAAPKPGSKAGSKAGAKQKAAPADAAKTPAGKPGTPAKPAKGSKPGRPGKQPAGPPAAAEPAAPAPPSPAAAAEPEAPFTGPADDDLPVLTHAPIAQAIRGRPLVFSAQIADASGVFQPLLYLRKKGMQDYLPIKLAPSKTAAGAFAAEVDARLVSADLEYYLECWDLAGNGPARAGSPESPFAIRVEEPAKPAAAVEKPVEEKRPPGAPPAIAHTTVTRTPMGQSLEIAARLAGDTGVSKAKVYFRRLGDKDYFELPMGNLGGDNYTATIPASQVTADLEYYLEASDRYGNGPGRSGGPNVPYFVTVEEKAEPEPGAPAAALPEPGPAATSTPPQTAATGTPAQPDPAAPASPAAQPAAQDASSTAPAEGEPGPPPAASSTAPEAPATAKPTPAQPTAAFTPSRPAKPGHRANWGRWVGYLAMGGFLGGLVVAGGESFGAWQASDTYDSTRAQYYSADKSPDEKLFYKPGVLQALASRSQAYAQRARVAGIASAASLVVGITLLIVFPSFPPNDLTEGPRASAKAQPLEGSAGDVGDLVLARF